MSHRSVCLPLVWRKQFSPKGEAFPRPFMPFLGLILVFKISKLLRFGTDFSKFYKTQPSVRGHLYLCNKSRTCATFWQCEGHYSEHEWGLGQTHWQNFWSEDPEAKKNKRISGNRSHEKWVTYGLLIAAPALCKASHPLRELTVNKVVAGQKVGGCASPLG